jgi:two-component system KDP operon response regulator KdpE
MADAPRILIVEDEPEIRRFLRVSLEHHGFRLNEVTLVREAIAQAAMQPPDLMILDLGLPDGDGLEVIANVRGWSPLPIIVLSARGQETDKVRALDAGADDYLTKPFGIEELLARVRVALRHSASGATADASAVFQVGELRIDQSSRRVVVREQEVHLTPTEYKLLTLLARHAGKVVTHRQILKEVWGPGSAQETQYLRVFMAALRQKLEEKPAQPRYLLTELGVGYRLAAE